MPKRHCNARTRANGCCRRPVASGHWRCRLHGGRAGRPRGTAMHPNTAAALKAGRARWLQRMRLAKQQGLIERFPNGRRPRGAPKPHSDKLIRKAQRIIERRIEEQAEMAKLHVVPGEESAAELHL